MARTRELLFKLFYSSSFTAVFLLVIGFVGVAPADKLYESYRRRRVIDIIIVAAAWVLTALIAAFMYGTRLFTTRSILRDIPKTFIPIERDDLPGRTVHRLIQETYSRSAVVAYQAKPRAKRIEIEVDGAGERMLVITKQIKQHHHYHILTPEERALLEPKWGTITHPGWQSPASAEMAGLEYMQVGDQLIDLIEAKAVSLAPADPLLTPNEDGSSPPDARYVDAVTRLDGTGMRTYLAQLAAAGVLSDPDLVDDFLSSFEQSRYGGKPISEPEFQTMMRLFAELLRNMQPPELDLLDFSEDDGDAYNDNNDDNDDDNYDDPAHLRKGKRPAQYTNGRLTAPTAQPRSSSTARSEASLSASSIVRHNDLASSSSPNQEPPPFHPSTSPPRSATASTASIPSTADSHAYTAYTARSALPTFTRTSASTPARSAPGLSRPPLTTRSTSHTSYHSATSLQGSLHSAHSGQSRRSGLSSGTSGSQGSVIRLVRAEAENRDVGRGDGLPYEIGVRGFQGR